MGNTERGNVKIVSWYTIDTEYSRVIKDYLISSCKKLNLNPIIYPVKSIGNWIKNTCLKPYIALKALKELNDDILLIDADAKILHFPELFNKIKKDYDIAYYTCKWREHYGYKNSNVEEICSGTLWFKNCDISRRLVEKWKVECQKINKPDQVVLQEVLKDFKELKVFNLPVEYCYINSLPRGKEPLIKPETIYISHYQASREMKRKV